MRCRCLLQNPRIKISIENNQRTPADMVLQLLRYTRPGRSVSQHRSGDIKPDSVRPFSAPGEVYPQKWCTTLWVNEQNMMYDRGGSKRRALKRQPVAALCLAHCRTECRVFFMLLICRSPHYFCFCWPALMPERRGHAELHAQKRHRQVIHRCHTVKRREQKFAQGISTCG